MANKQRNCLTYHQEYNYLKGESGSVLVLFATLYSVIPPSSTEG